MADQSKMASANFTSFLIDILAGSRNKQLVSATILLIIGFLLHIKNKKSYTENIKFKQDKTKVLN